MITPQRRPLRFAFKAAGSLALLLVAGCFSQHAVKTPTSVPQASQPTAPPDSPPPAPTEWLRALQEAGKIPEQRAHMSFMTQEEWDEITDD